MGARNRDSLLPYVNIQVCPHSPLILHIGRHLNDPILDNRYAQWPLAPVCLLNVYPPHRLRFIHLVSQLSGYAVEISLCPSFHLLYALKGYSIHSTGPFVRSRYNPQVGTTRFRVCSTHLLSLRQRT